MDHVDVYLNGPRPFGLHLGCGDNILPNWLNTDAIPRADEVVEVDVAETLPFDDATFDFIFTEHLIEHLAYESGRLTLRECHRVLVEGGVVRIATPSIGFLLRLFSRDRSDLESNYIDWAFELCEDIRSTRVPMTAFVFNNFVRAWGHKFIYDRDTLAMTLRDVGFTEVDERPISESPHDMLCGLEHVRRLPPGFLDLETMVLEARK